MSGFDEIMEMLDLAHAEAADEVGAMIAGSVFVPAVFVPADFDAIDAAVKARMDSAMERLNELVSEHGTAGALSALRTRAITREAEEIAHGRRHLTVVHGDLETADDDNRLRALHGTAEAVFAAGSYSTRATNDTVTFSYDGPDADAAIDALAAGARRFGYRDVRQANR